ncbi:MAG: phosphoglucomutase/phosphomannomutase family protein, partial [Synechococcales cyanobacterium]
QVVASSLQAHGHTIVLSNTFAPTPALSWAVKEFNALGAIVITASHNPGKYSGLKIKGAFGGSVPTEITHRMEA